MNTKLRKEAKNEFQKDFFKLMNISVSEKTMENVRKNRDIKLVTSDKIRKRLVSEPNYHSYKKFSKYLMAIEMEKTNVKMNKPIYLGMSILDISKRLIYKFWYDYIKPKYGDKVILCYIDTVSFILYIITEEFYEDIAIDVERWFDTSSFDEICQRSLPIGNNKKVPGLSKDELRGKNIIEFCALRSKTYAYLMDDDSENKKAKGTKKYVIKRKGMFENYNDCLFNELTILKPQQRFKSDYHKLHTEEVDKIALSNNDDKRLQTFDGVTTFPYGVNPYIVCESEMLIVKNSKILNIMINIILKKQIGFLRQVLQNVC